MIQGGGVDVPALLVYFEIGGSSVGISQTVFWVEYYGRGVVS